MIDIFRIISDMMTIVLLRRSLLRFNTAPLGAVHSGGAGDLFPRDCTALNVISLIPQSSALRIFIFELVFH